MAARDRPHIIVPFDPTTERYSPYSSPRGGALPPSPADPRTYGEGLLAQLAASTATGNERRQDAVRVTGALDGLYMTFEGQPNVDLALESLEPQQGRQPPELKSVKLVETDKGAVQQAVVFVPDSAVPTYVKRLEQYATETTRTGRPRHSNLVERIRAIRLASLEELWTEPDEAFPPATQDVWWEIWLRRRDDGEINRFHIYADTVGIEVGDRELVFDDRVVLLAFGSAERLGSSLDALDDLAELRKPRPLATFLPDLPPAQQADWVDDLLSRTAFPDEGSPAVTILDSGVQRAHPLLEHALDEADCHTCEPAWGTADHDGHGTQMSGLALYGSVDTAVSSGDGVELSCRLESVKVLPPAGANDPSLYGAIVASAVGRVEIAAPRRRRAFVMAVSSRGAEESSNLGQPTSWSATIDALSVGRGVVEQPGGLVYLSEPEEQEQRLFILSAGNVDHPWEEAHLDRSDITPVEDPGQSWNAITVGAFTDIIDMGSEPQYAGWQAVAPAGELSPASRTSVAFERRWPLKPEIVCEGGNAARNATGTEVLTAAPLQVLTTAHLQGGQLFTSVDGTSPAAAKAANIAGGILAEYSSLWPETVRALIVHSAEWTPRMYEAFDGADTRAKRVGLLRRYGMGVPSSIRATRSASDAVTLVAEGFIRPYENGRLRELNFHSLPWPTEALEALGETQVRLRVTLSYFVTPNPARRGWVRRYSYPSHGLRFDVRLAHESDSDFRKRLNRLALAEEEPRPSGRTDASEWMFGPGERVRGSLHTDIWRGSATDLASRGSIAVYPVSGWWKERPKSDRSDQGVRYALIASIESPEVEVDLWTPIAVQVEAPVEVFIESRSES